MVRGLLFCAVPAPSPVVLRSRRSPMASLMALQRVRAPAWRGCWECGGGGVGGGAFLWPVSNVLWLGWCLCPCLGPTPAGLGSPPSRGLVTGCLVVQRACGVRCVRLSWVRAGSWGAPKRGPVCSSCASAGHFLFGMAGLVCPRAWHTHAVCACWSLTCALIALPRSRDVEGARSVWAGVGRVVFSPPTTVCMQLRILCAVPHLLVLRPPTAHPGAV